MITFVSPAGRGKKPACIRAQRKKNTGIKRKRKKREKRERGMGDSSVVLTFELRVSLIRGGEPEWSAGVESGAQSHTGPFVFQQQPELPPHSPLLGPVIGPDACSPLSLKALPRHKAQNVPDGGKKKTPLRSDPPLQSASNGGVIGRFVGDNHFRGLS